MPPVFIHLGLPKTATTTLQRHLFEQHSQIYYLGKYAGYGFTSAVQPFMPDDFVDALASKFEPGNIHLQSLETQLAYAVKNNLRPLLSRESLAAGTVQKKTTQALLFKQAFNHCKVILFVREPESFIKSRYLEMLKAFQKQLNERTSWMQKLGEPPHYFDIDEWLSLALRSSEPIKQDLLYMDNSPVHYLCYADTADIYAEVFGRENIKIFIFEEFVRSPKTLITKLCDYMGIDAEEGFNLVDGKRENDRITTGYIDRLKAIEASSVETLKFRASEPRQRTKMLKLAEDQGQKIIPELTDVWRDKIHAVGDAQNRRLVSEWGLPLADYGYRV
jgi:hypothetical protein